MLVESNGGVGVRDQLVTFTNNKTRKAPSQFGHEAYLAMESNGT